MSHITLTLTDEESYLTIYALHELANRRRQSAIERGDKTPLATEFQRFMLDESNRLNAIAERVRHLVRHSNEPKGVTVDCSHRKVRSK